MKRPPSMPSSPVAVGRANSWMRSRASAAAGSESVPGTNHRGVPGSSRVGSETCEALLADARRMRSSKRNAPTSPKNSALPVIHARLACSRSVARATSSPLERS